MTSKLILMTLLLIGTTLCNAATTKVESFAKAIARAEGYYVPHSLPNRYNNPGDLKARASEQYPGQLRIGKKGHVVFKTPAAGWAALYKQIDRIMDGTSRFYTPNTSLLQMSKMYARNYRVWARNIAHNLNVPVTTTLDEYFDTSPRVLIVVNFDDIKFLLRTTHNEAANQGLHLCTL